jgi:hypothetical protein
MTRRQATQPELQALTTTAIALAMLAFTWTPGIAAIPAAALTYLAATTAGARALRWDLPHTLHANQLILRSHAAAAIRATAWTVKAIATALLLTLNAAHTRILNTDHTVAA